MFLNICKLLKCIYHRRKRVNSFSEWLVRFFSNNLRILRLSYWDICKLKKHVHDVPFFFHSLKYNGLINIMFIYLFIKTHPQNYIISQNNSYIVKQYFLLICFCIYLINDINIQLYISMTIIKSQGLFQFVSK